mmetsp:Transcript_157750/g.383040  ORF Transcript_157750/g.383040 Transcript_157750/m.383040 type:complete len:304 (-) Transcript_157750:1012-1923(-)
MQAGWQFWRLAQRFWSLKTTSMESYGSQSTRFSGCRRWVWGATLSSMRLFIISLRSSSPLFDAFLPSAFILGLGMRPMVGRLAISSGRMRASSTSSSHCRTSLFFSGSSSASSSSPAASASSVSARAPSASAPAAAAPFLPFLAAFLGTRLVFSLTWYRLGMWYICFVVGSQKVTQPSSLVMTQACSVVLYPSPQVPLQTKASFLQPSSREQSSTAWSCTEPRRRPSTSWARCQLPIWPAERCRAGAQNSVQRTQCWTFSGSASEAGRARGRISLGSGRSAPPASAYLHRKRRFGGASGNHAA